MWLYREHGPNTINGFSTEFMWAENCKHKHLTEELLRLIFRTCSLSQTLMIHVWFLYSFPFSSIVLVRPKIELAFLFYLQQFVWNDCCFDIIGLDKDTVTSLTPVQFKQMRKGIWSALVKPLPSRHESARVTQELHLFSTGLYQRVLFALTCSKRHIWVSKKDKAWEGFLYLFLYHKEIFIAQMLLFYSSGDLMG